jgi:ribonuclease HI
MKIERLTLSADGASRGNPGPAAIGASIKDGQGRVVARISRQIGIATNNQAEYRALIAGLSEAIRLGARIVDIMLDSELVVRQISGEYRVKNAALKSLLEQVRQLTGCLESFTVTHVSSRQNLAAHRLADVALRPLAGNNRA